MLSLLQKTKKYVFCRQVLFETDRQQLDTLYAQQMLLATRFSVCVCADTNRHTTSFSKAGTPSEPALLAAHLCSTPLGRHRLEAHMRLLDNTRLKELKMQFPKKEPDELCAEHQKSVCTEEGEGESACQ